MPDPTHNSARVSRARVAAAARWGGPGAANELRREHKELMLRQYAERVISEWPPLTDAQKARLSALFAPVPATADDAGQVAA